MHKAADLTVKNRRRSKNFPVVAVDDFNRFLHNSFLLFKYFVYNFIMSSFRLLTALRATRPLPINSQNQRFVANKSHEFTFARRQFSKALKDVENGSITRKSSKPNGTFKLTLLGACIGAVAGSTYTIYTRICDKNSHKEHERTPPKVVEFFPADVRITKRFINPKDTSGLDIVLFQYQTCPFCCKVRAYLDYMGISYSVVEVDAVLRQDIRWSEVKKVPMVLIRQQDGRYVQMTDSSAIISLVASSIHDNRIDVGELAQFYPHISYFDDDGKKRQDILNKYFLMYQDRTPKNMTKEIEE